jgi:diguanylate cyclase (GGDEF)-like protein
MTDQQNLTTDFDQDREDVIEQLLLRIGELEDFQHRVEANAADTIAMAEDLAVAKDQAESALKQAKAYQEQIEALALYDPLTGLANRREFQRAFDDAIAYAKRHGTVIALLLFDLDRFKEVNDTYGHPVGDELLKYIADTLRESTRETDTVARLGGDEFAIILTGIEVAEKCAYVANRVIEVLSQPVVLSGCLINTGTSIGISVFPKDGREAPELLLNGDKALYEAKSKGRGVFRFFEQSLDEKAKIAHVLESDLRMAIVRNEFVLHFQPQKLAICGDITGAEALVRWNHPTRGFLYPDQFISSAEENGLIFDIGRIILNTACRECQKWRDEGHGSISVAVNISSVQFRDKMFVETVENALAESGLDPNYLELEITESVMMDQSDFVVENLRRLRGLGIEFAIDDFGTGYSSLAHLKHLPVQKLKLDKVFIDGLANDAADLAIVEAVINLGHSLNLKIVADGVESPEQAKILSAKECDVLQGFLIAKAMPADTFLQWLSGAGRLNRTEKTT